MLHGREPLFLVKWSIPFYCSRKERRRESRVPAQIRRSPPATDGLRFVSAGNVVIGYLMLFGTQLYPLPVNGDVQAKDGTPNTCRALVWLSNCFGFHDSSVRPEAANVPERAQR